MLFAPKYSNTHRNITFHARVVGGNLRKELTLVTLLTP